MTDRIITADGVKLAVTQLVALEIAGHDLALTLMDPGLADDISDLVVRIDARIARLMTMVDPEPG